MAILTVDQFSVLFDKERIKQLASDFDYAHNKTIYDASKVSTVIAQAEGIIKNALCRQYTTAQLEADAGIQRITADLAIYYLELRRGDPSGATVRIFGEAKERISRLQDGTEKLDAVSELLPTGSTTEPTEAIKTGFFSLTDAEEASLR